jgi:hypothetical protein
MGLTRHKGAASVETLCFDRSYSQVTDKMIGAWDSVFIDQGIDDNAFAQLMYIIQIFTSINDDGSDKCFVLDEILLDGITNRKSNAIAISAIMQKRGWDVVCFYSEEEIYLGINFNDEWTIRMGHWVEKNGKKYYLKEIDYQTPAGVINCKTPASLYMSLEAEDRVLKSIPLIQSMPEFTGPEHDEILRWYYQDKEYSIHVLIPESQVEWTHNLPYGLSGMVASGIMELRSINIPEQFIEYIDDMDEFNQVNFLLKFCQAKEIFAYDNTQPIKSVSLQLTEKRNDCDGRSVLLHCLLLTVLGYSNSDVVFVTWPNHVALGVRPKTLEALVLLKDNGYHVGNGYYLLDAAYAGETCWGSKMDRLEGECEIIY